MKKTDVRAIYLGLRKLDLIEGLIIKEYLPDAIMKNVHMALDDQGMEWVDEIIEDCTLIISPAGFKTVMYKYDALFFKGLMLFGFIDEPEHEYRFSFPMKQFHIEYYMKRR